MTPTRNVRLSRLVMDGDLEQVPLDADTCREMVSQARRHLRTAAWAQTDGDLEGAFQLAYDGCRKVVHAYVLAWAVRPAGKAHHASTFNAAGALLRGDPATRALVRLVDDATDLRYARAGAQYEAEKIDAALVTDALAILDELLTSLPPLLEARLPPSDRSPSPR